MSRSVLRVGVGVALCALSLGAMGEEPVPSAAELRRELDAAQLKISQLEEDLFVLREEAGGAEDASVVEVDLARRSPMGVLFPKTTPIGRGRVFARFSHVSQNQSFAGAGDPLHDLLGLDSGVRIGIMLGYGILDNWDVTVQRTTGRDYLDAAWSVHSYDQWDVMTKVKLLDESDRLVDCAVSAGATCFWQSNGRAEWSGNAAALVEKTIWRFRLGTGALYSSLSDFGATRSSQALKALDKYYPSEHTFGAPRPARHTVAIPVGLAFSLTSRLSVFGEAAFPVAGYETDLGPSAAAGCRYTTPNHAYSVYLSNTSNNSFNSTITGAYKRDRLDVFGFDISIFF